MVVASILPHQKAITISPPHAKNLVHALGGRVGVAWQPRPWQTLGTKADWQPFLTRIR
jgi:hypothetical protein